MTRDRAKIVVSRRLPEAVEARMAALFDVSFNQSDVPLDAPALLTALHDAEVLVSSITDRIDSGLIAQLPASVKLIAQFGNGFDNVNIEAAHAAGITVTNTPSVLTEDTADMAMALMLSVPRRLTEGAQVLLNDGTWPGWSPTWMLGRRLGGKALGIVGLGRIGTAVARRARAFGLAIHYCGRTRKPPQIEEALGATWWDSIDEMVEHVDIISLHTPHNRDTFNILSADRLGRLRDGAFVVNISRPELVDEDALADLVASGHLSGAALDVFEHKKGANPKLVELARANKVILTPHMGSATLESRIEMGETVIVNIRTFLDGHTPPHRVLPDGRSPI
ncbi:D-glycerate dehydrogenase [Pelagibacterium sp. 26DY04]|uniref:2-hydroxyacid dehydrogenase n=1 Tax=Pelagibacterium sp. 26DY04 TaxID=2967130 RepID=UPI002815CE58|nr:D-glycerate dehydrogenase [Pelagibacterium sp. 26DY04]WMT87122.1 D-glycerate dehydrogenase [Pelagibacterium sp. 26DY04]